MMNRRRFVAGTVVAGLIPFAPLAFAQNVTKPARMLAGFPPGGTIDAVARLLVERMKGYAPSLIVENRTGAGGRLALDALKDSEPDGSVMAITPGDQLTLFPHIFSRLSYKPLGDFTPVTTVCSVQFLLTVGPLVPASVKSLAEFVAWTREHPSSATYGTAGAGTRPHFLAAILARAAGVPLSHVPYKGNPQAMQDLLGGQVAANISTISNALPHVQAGKLRALATTAPRRSVAFPEVPTFRELGYPDLEAVEWFGILVPARTPQAMVDALHSTIRTAIGAADYRAGLARLSLDVAESSPADLVRLIETETRRWAGVVNAVSFKPLE